MFVEVKDLVVGKEYYLTDRGVNSERARGIFVSLDDEGDPQFKATSELKGLKELRGFVEFFKTEVFEPVNKD